MGKELLAEFKPGHDRLVCIDSDGCVFDTMDLKDKEWFCPAMIKHWGLQPISKYARKAWEFENLYSRDRGQSRFITLYRTIELLKDWDEIREYGFQLPDTEALGIWLRETPAANHQSLERSDDPVLMRTLKWSLEVNERVADMVRGIPPFPYSAEVIRALSGQADIMVVSATARDALMREWEENGLLDCVAMICSQDEGTKKECIQAVKDHYSPDRVLMIGDAPGDRKAAYDNGVLFYPVRPGEEIRSWKEMKENYLSQFLDWTYREKSQTALIESFNSCLPVTPPWKEQGSYSWFS